MVQLLDRAVQVEVVVQVVEQVLRLLLVEAETAKDMAQVEH